jgi:hypothetical protein
VMVSNAIATRKASKFKMCIGLTSLIHFLSGEIPR